MAKTAYESAHYATEIFRTFKEGDPELWDLGLKEVTDNIGGMFPGNLVGIGAGQNVGKSSLILTMAMTSEHKVGVIELEDGPDVWGARLLAFHSGVPPTNIRRKDLTEEQKDAISEAMSKDMKGPLIEYAIGGSVDKIVAAAKRLYEAGCRIIVLNYLQKSRGHHSERRMEVGLTMNKFLQCSAPDPEEGYEGFVPVAMSQLVRIHPTKEPFPSHMKESGDIEAECRLIVMLWRDPNDWRILRCKVAKSSFGGGGLRFAYRFTDAEYLEQYHDDDGEEF